MKHFYLTLLFLLTCTLVFGQTATIRGKVQSTGGKAIAKATVRLEGTKIVSVTNEDGGYELKEVPYGQQHIVVTSVEINPKRLPVLVDSRMHVLPIALELRGDIGLEEVRVEGKTEKRKIETSGFAVNVIETQEAATRNVQTNELLDRTVGVRVRQSGGVGAEVQYNLNGMTGRSVGIFVDGIEISTYGASFNLNNIPPAMIERIEVYKGVLPAHLSGDLLGGAINIVLNKRNVKNNLNASLSYGSFNTTQADVSGFYRDQKTGFTTRISGAFLNSDNDYEIWGKFSKYIEPNGVVRRNFRTKRFFDGYRSATARFEFGFSDVKWADSFFLGYNFSDVYNEIQHGQTMGTPYMGRTSQGQANALNLHYNKRDLFVKGLSLNVNGVYSFRNTAILDTVPWAYNWDGAIRLDLNGKPLKTLTGAQQGKPTHIDIDRQVANIRSNLAYEFIKGHRLSANHVFYTVDRKDTDLLNVVAAQEFRSKNDLSKNVFSFNYEASTLNDRLLTNLFYKLYQQTIGNTWYTSAQVGQQAVAVKEEVRDARTNSGYGLSVSYAIIPKVYLLTSAERAVRMPADSETFGSPEDNVLSNFSIKPEVSDNYNAGFRLGMYEFGNHRLSLSGNAFWRNIKDRIMPKANENISAQEIEVTQFINLGRAQTLGFEGEFTYGYKNKLTAMVNFSKFNSLFKQQYDDEGREMTYYNKQVPNEPFFTINGNVHYRFENLIQRNSQLNMFYTVGYVAPFRTIWPETDWFITPRQWAQNVGASYTFPSRRLIASVDVKNLFNAEVYDNFGVQKPGRGYYLKLSYSLFKF